MFLNKENGLKLTNQKERARVTTWRARLGENDKLDCNEDQRKVKIERSALQGFKKELEKKFVVWKVKKKGGKHKASLAGQSLRYRRRRNSKKARLC